MWMLFDSFIKFIRQYQQSINLLLIEFFETAQLYKIEKASEGIKKMLHLIWTKDNNDMSKSINRKLSEVIYRTRYFDIRERERESPSWLLL